MNDEFDATRCPKCADVWRIVRIQPKAARATPVHLRICQCDMPHCTNDRCKKPVPFGAKSCPACGRT